MSRIAGSEPIRALIIGCGAIAGGYDEAAPDSSQILTHAKAYLRHPKFQMVGCVEPDREKRAKFMWTWEIPKGFASLADVDIPYDVASVCVPTQYHAETLEALLTGPARLVFAEKPLTDDLERSRAIVRAYREAGKPLAVNYLRRWAPGLIKLKAEIEAGRWGSFIKGSAWYTKGLLNNGSHFLDLAAFLLGDLRPVARLGAINDGRSDDPTLDVLVKTGHDAPLYLLGANANAYSIFEADLLFAEGRISLTDSGFHLVRRTVTRSSRFTGYSVLGPARGSDSGLGQAMLDAADNIARNLVDQTPLNSTGRTALVAQELCAALACLPET
ncbi:oxidoreductase domain protein [Paramagnetospirillum magnetotacticum MS-1]|uniref:Oxidoreductase domain protein n=1 Tax=Paramagnetospirillum magnetotacticum MS-1 TaxID=272627 RepID=A0A0C2YQ02_PARME|nr:Gfo/Idh/MocA family oxidoreductase [Paramagnetospirillum magnetotacticum]KIL97193.1 oxidoreductase domain protein [Paramagnetospirillum magnetotacticum MS-1]